jgi:hypothetical protein
MSKAITTYLKYDNDLVAAGDYLASAQAVPKNTNADGDEGSVALGGTLGKIEIRVKAASEVTIHNTKVITIIVQDSADDSSFSTIATILSHTASGDKVWAAGDILARFVLPSNCRKYVKVNIATTDASAAGTLDIYPVYMPE